MDTQEKEKQTIPDFFESRGLSRIQYFSALQMACLVPTSENYSFNRHICKILVVNLSILILI